MSISHDQMGFLKEVISCAEKIEIQTLVNKVGEISSEAENYKEEVNRYLDNVYLKFTERQGQNRVLLDKALKLVDELTALKKTADDLTKKDLVEAAVDFNNLKSQLEETNTALSVANHLIHIHEACVKANKFLENELFVESVREIVSVKSFIKAIPNDEIVETVHELIINVQIAENCLLSKITDVFLESVVMESNDEFSKLKICKTNDLLIRVLNAFFLYSPFIELLSKVTKFLWNSIFVPVVDNAVVEVSTSEKFYVLELKKQESSKDKDYKFVFSNLKTVLQFLSAHFDFQLANDVSTLTYIGQDLRDNLSELLIKRCLENTIPSTAEGLQEYKTVIADTESLQNDLVASKIFNEETTSIIEYANNIDILFINKKCQEYLNTAVVLMKKDLHDLTEVGVIHDMNNPLEDVVSDEFSRCCVSKSCLEILRLAEKLLEQCETSSEVSCGRLLCTTQNIFYMYGNVVYEHHQKLLETIPQQIGLFYNNCNYLAHMLIKWNKTYKGMVLDLMMVF